MRKTRPQSAERHMELIISRLLRAGVILAALVVLTGGLLYLSKYGANPVELKSFQGEPVGLRRVGEILSGAIHLHRRALIQLGLLLLIATPVSRVLFSVFAFAQQRDYTYVAITLIVLGLLAFSVLGAIL